MFKNSCEKTKLLYDLYNIFLNTSDYPDSIAINPLILSQFSSELRSYPITRNNEFIKSNLILNKFSLSNNVNKNTYSHNKLSKKKDYRSKQNKYKSFSKISSLIKLINVFINIKNISEKNEINTNLAFGENNCNEYFNISNVLNELYELNQYYFLLKCVNTNINFDDFDNFNLRNMYNIKEITNNLERNLIKTCKKKQVNNICNNNNDNNNNDNNNNINDNNNININNLTNKACIDNINISNVNKPYNNISTINTIINKKKIKNEASNKRVIFKHTFIGPKNIDIEHNSSYDKDNSNNNKNNNLLASEDSYDYIKEIINCIYNNKSFNVVEDNTVSKLNGIKKQCINKRLRCNFNNYVYNIINSYLNEISTTKCLIKLTTKYSNCLSFKFVNNYMNSTIKHVYCNISESSDCAKRCENNINTLTFAEKNHNKLNKFIKKTFNEAYSEYLNSTEYLKSLKVLDNKKGRKYLIDYINISQEFLKLYVLNES